MKTHTLGLRELETSELQSITGGGIIGDIGYGIGYAVGSIVQSVKGAYEQGYDSGQDQCGCS